MYIVKIYIYLLFCLLFLLWLLFDKNSDFFFFRYNGLYGQQAASARSIENNYIPRGSSRANEGRTKEAKAPPVQTIRNYNKVNDDGSFTFGYEAADGSFKEETRGKLLNLICNLNF